MEQSNVLHCKKKVGLSTFVEKTSNHNSSDIDFETFKNGSNDVTFFCFAL